MKPGLYFIYLKALVKSQNFKNAVAETLSYIERTSKNQ